MLEVSKQAVNPFGLDTRGKKGLKDLTRQLRNTGYKSPKKVIKRKAVSVVELYVEKSKK